MPLLYTSATLHSLSIHLYTFVQRRSSLSHLTWLFRSYHTAVYTLYTCTTLPSSQYLPLCSQYTLVFTPNIGPMCTCPVPRWQPQSVHLTTIEVNTWSVHLASFEHPTSLALDYKVNTLLDFRVNTWPVWLTCQCTSHLCTICICAVLIHVLGWTVCPPCLCMANPASDWGLHRCTAHYSTGSSLVSVTVHVYDHPSIHYPTWQPYHTQYLMDSLVLSQWALSTSQW